MNVLLLQLDGKMPNLALMRLAHWCRSLGHTVTLRRAANLQALQPRLDDPQWGEVLGSAIFSATRPLAYEAQRIYPTIILGGTGIDVRSSLEALGMKPWGVDYSDYPMWSQSIGFTQRGCRLKCKFCVVPEKEGPVREEKTIWQIYRGEPWPRHLILLDNDFFGQPKWEDRIQEILDGKFKVSLSQGINARFLTEAAAASLALIDYRDDSMKVKRLYTAWDNLGDEARLFRGLELLVKYGIKPDHIMVYMLIGYWKGETRSDWEYRRKQLRAFGCRPYPMPFVRTPETVGFQRWVIGAYDKRIPWSDWEAARMRPERLAAPGPLL